MKKINLKLRTMFFALLIAFINTANAITIEAIRIEGLFHTSPNAVEGALQLRVGNTFSPTDAQESIRRIFALGHYRNVDIYIGEEGEQTVSLIVRLEEFPLLELIEFEGNRKIRTRELEEANVLTLYQAVSEARLFDAQRKILDMYSEKGYLLASVEPQLINTMAGGAIVKFSIDEGPRVRVRTINFEGHESVSDRWLHRRLKTRENRWWRSGNFDQELYRAHLDTLILQFNDLGFLDAEVVRDSVWFSDDGRDVFIDITINEGRRYIAGDIAVTGNTVIPTENLLRRVALNPGRPFRISQFEMTRFMLETAYREEGYLWVRVEDTRSFRSAGSATPSENISGIDLNASITQIIETILQQTVTERFGQAVGDAVSTVVIDAVNAELSRVSASNNIGGIIGDVVAQKVSQEVARLVSGPAGRAGANAVSKVVKKSVETAINELTGGGSAVPDTVDVLFTITEGRPAIVRRVDIRGNTKTWEKVIRREITLMPGQRYRQSRMMTSQQNIMRLNYFTAVVPDISPNDDGTIDIIFDITERDNIGMLSLGAAYSDQDGLAGTFSTSIPNLRGRGQELRLEAQWGQWNRVGSISFTEPWFRDMPLWLTGTFFAQELIRDRYDWFNSQYVRDDRLTSIGIRVGVGRSRLPAPFERFRFQTIYQISHESMQRQPFELRENFHIVETGTMSRLRLNIERYDLDMPLFPNEGTRLTITPELAGLGGDFQYFKGTMRYENYFRLPGKFVFGSEVSLGIITEGLGGEINISANDLFTAGGAYGDGVVRGFPDWQFGGGGSRNRIAGDGISMFAVNLSLRYPVIDQQIYVGLFADMGNTWPEISGIDVSDLYRGIGGGIRMNLPMIGVMGVDVGYGLDPLNRNDFGAPVSGWNWHIIMNKGF